MRIIVRIAIVLALIAALVYGALWGASWYKVKQEVDDAIAQVAPYAEIRYASIFASPKLDGTVGLDRIVIKPKMSSDEFKIQSVRVTFPGLFHFITSKQDEIPESMRLSISGVSLDLNSPLLISLSQMQKQAKRLNGQKSELSFVNYETLGCGAVESIGLDELTRMGYQTMDIDLDMEYDYQRIKNLLALSMVTRFKGMQAVDIKAELRVSPADLAQGKMANAVIDSVRIDIADGGYATLRNRFCAAELESTEEVYLGNHLVLLSRELKTTFPPETVEAYKKYMRGGRMSLAIAPKPGTEFATLDRFAVKDIIDMVGLQLKLDSHEVDFAKFEWGKSFVMPKQEIPGETAKSTTTAPLPVTKTYTPPRFRATPPSRLGNFVGYKVQLKTRAGVARDGVIESAEPGAIILRQTDRGRKGFISFSIALSDIASAEVFY